MNRRQFLSAAGALAGCTGYAGHAFALSVSRSIDALVLVDLNGGNDGLNTVIPFSDAHYRALRPTLAIPHERILPLDERTALHPSLLPLMSAWRAKEWAIVQGVGYASGNRSHFRSQQIWHTASDADEYLHDDWLARLGVAADGHDVGVHARTFASSCNAAARIIAIRRADTRPTVIRLTLHGFDTHENQAGRHASLLAELADGLASLRGALIASNAWHRTFVMTHSEFGRSARENAAGGTDHGAASVQFVLGGNVHGGRFGLPPRLDQLDEAGGLPVAVDFRRLYATVASGWRIDSAQGLGQRFEPLPLLRV